jgi:hypothetical protein
MPLVLVAMTSSLYDNICFNRPIGSFPRYGGEIMFGFVQHVGRDAMPDGCSSGSAAHYIAPLN